MTQGSRVVVVGAGPTGLFTALGLARKGAQVTVIDAEPRVNDSPRANVYMLSTIKALDEYGLLEDALRVAARGYEFNMRFPLTGNVARLKFELLEGLTYTYTLHFGQNVLAEILLKHFLELPGAQMRWNTRFVSLAQKADGVEVSVESEGVQDVIEADWMVGADGARSSVRKALDLEFGGFTWPETFMATNVYYDFDKHGYAASNMVAAGADWHVVAKVSDDGLWRIAYGEDANLTEEQRRARIPDRFANFLPDRAEFELERANSYRVHQRCASSMRVGRVLLAGDAAHATNPIGGMGFTSGVQDAKALVDALGRVIAGDCDDDILDYYSSERRRVFLQIANPSAIDQKRRVQETDREVRLKDEAEFMAATTNPEIAKMAMMSVFQLEGKPYQPGRKA
ncbi:hypothetical protein CIC12_20405 [Burkholderia sp. SG-MS1]|uniref:FAD-dependent oxidoreductase n=1 Tax=Paraburkholderia sp. SG-MS1 TaxID=2023741 RepID=UPI001445BF7B|nr:FAD-dependent oxidoreductase [Paraburkholderia sp. SG-MS1]NKJ49055.1 hypothetical protein [Paraburkholderia sp. SG-MS1]